MGNNSQNATRLAKNTIVLYCRMVALMIISLYTSRVNLNALGVEDYGIYNVVGGVVLMFSVVSGSLSASITRFLTFELGAGDKTQLRRVFSSAVIIQIILAFIIIILSETVGIWYINNKMVIPEGRLVAAHWVFQFSIITFAVNLVSLPYNAVIIAHEKMSTFAWLGIYEGISKLAIAYLILYSSFDRLIFYGALNLFLAVSLRIIYQIYCKRKFEECNLLLEFDNSLLKKMFGFAGWNFIGSSASILRDQGGTLLINLYFGPAVNAARAIANRVNEAVIGFVKNFLTALNPQITKSYASGDMDYLYSILFRGSKFSFFLMLFLSLPILLNTHYVLVTWLNLVPEHTVLFVQLTLLFALSETISYPLVTAQLATGNIRNYQIVVGGLEMMNLPTSYVLLKMGAMPECIMYVAIFYSQVCFFSRLLMLRKMIGLDMIKFLKEVYSKALFVLVIAGTFPLLVRNVLEEGFVSFLVCSSLCVMTSSISILYVGCNDHERGTIISQLKKKLFKREK